MKSLMLDENNLYNKDVLEGDFLVFARSYVSGKARAGKDTEHYKSALLYTQLVAKGEDIYIISKMLNHKHVKTTQVYSKVPDQNRVNAANKLLV